MKDLRTYLYEEVGWDADQDLAYEYIGAFKRGWFDPVEDDRLSDIDMWDSMGDTGQQYILRNAQFTGAIDRTTCYPKILIKKTNTSLKELLEIIGDRVSNIFYNGKPNPDWDFYTLKYKDKQPVDIQDIDPEDTLTYLDYISPRKNWKNMVKKENLEWIIDQVGDNIWFRDANSLKSLAKYTGWDVYIKGKKL